MLNIYDVEESEAERPGRVAFTAICARSPAGIVLVFNRRRVAWELPGGYLDPGETPRQGAQREFLEETGQHSGQLTWLGMFSIDTDAVRQYGTLFGCQLAAVPGDFCCDEIAGLAHWNGEHAPRPLGSIDEKLLRRFAGSI